MGIYISSLPYIHPDKDALFSNISFSINPHQKTAIVGRNGTGKSTLLQIIAGVLQASQGSVSVNGLLYYVPQHTGQFNGHTVAQALGAEAKLNALHAILGGDTNPEHFTSLNDEWDIEERIRAALAQWQLGHINPQQEMQHLSGGEKTRVFMAGITLAKPDVLLLDEPTNHMDAEGRELLYRFIAETRATVLMVSHDINLLRLADVTLELGANSIQAYGGNYDFYKEQKKAETAALEARLDDSRRQLKQAQQKAHETEEKRNRQEARGAAGGDKGLPRILAGRRKSQAEQSTVRMKDVHNEKVEGLQENMAGLRSRIEPHKALRLDFGSPTLYRGKVLAEARGINIVYGEQLLWKEFLDFKIHQGDRVHIKGSNGAGKTTLLNMLMHKLLPTEGSLLLGGFSCLYLDQEYSMIDNSMTVFGQAEAYNRRKLPEHEVRMQLHNHGLPREVWDKPCGVMSGGQRMKLIFCCLYLEHSAADVVVLDEPTNNLDIASQEALLDAVTHYTGTLVMVSHDKNFTDAIGPDNIITL